MRLLTEIIEALSGDQSGLVDALFKAKVLSHRLGDADLKRWVDSELSGYSDDAAVPPYRCLHVTIMGQVSDGFNVYNDQVLPVFHLEKRLRDKLTATELRESIAVVEQFSKSEHDLVIAFQPEYFPALRKGLRGGFEILRAWGKHSVGAHLQVVTEVRARLLEFVLNLEGSLPEDVDARNLRQIAEDVGVHEMFKGAVFGDNVNINIGSGSQSHLSNAVHKNDFAGLAQVLREHGVGEEDIGELRQAVEEDGTRDTERSYGPKVKQWMGGMIAKAGSAAWNVGVQAAGGVLANAISAYYGFSS
ncbi:hypothetical protein ACLKMY_24810 [Paraburkholderia mimosarum]|uniref:AbiTii domain-containing protein n=1 Tax=Paraburkholderia mimosarum TaxID=312026 RepID=UPI0039C02DB9